MSKIIAAINMTLDGNCDHTAVDPDEEIHDHYSELLSSADVLLYGRKTYELMKFWQTLIENPSGEKSMDDFAIAMDKVPKIVFSHTLKDTEWQSATLANQSLEAVINELKLSSNGSGKEIYIGSKSLNIQLMNLHLLDELQLCIHPVVAGGGLPLFEDVKDRTLLKLVKTKTFSGGAVVLYYEQDKMN